MTQTTVAQTILEMWGAAVEAVPTSAKQESDWVAELDGFRLLVEEKTKFEDPRSAEARDYSLAQTAAHSATASVRPSNRISGVVRKAAKQLDSTATDVAHHARVIWLTSVGFDREAKDQQAFNTLYGATKVGDLDGENSLRDCFFFYNSEFFRHQNVDGAYVVEATEDEATVRLCLNPFSPRWMYLRDSPFAKKLTRGLVDPVALEAASEAFLVDGQVDRRDESSVLRFLQEKYRRPKLFKMDMNMATVVLAVPARG